MQEILDWLLAHPVLALIVIFSLIGSGSSKKSKRTRKRQGPLPKPGSPKGTPAGGEQGEKDWMEALRDLVKDPEQLSKKKPKFETHDGSLSSAEMEVPERFQDVDSRSASPDLPPTKFPQNLPQPDPKLRTAGAANSIPTVPIGMSWEEGSVFSKERVSGGGYSGTGGMAAADFGNFRETKAFAGQGGDLVFESSLDNMELKADHSSIWGAATQNLGGGLGGIDPQILLLGQILLGPPRGLRSYEEEALLPGIEA
jgi:hypothetical protein